MPDKPLGRAKFRVGQVVRIPGPSWVRILSSHKPQLYLGKWDRDYEVEGLDEPCRWLESEMKPLTKREKGKS